MTTKHTINAATSAAMRDYTDILASRIPFFEEYENATLCHHSDYQQKHKERTVPFSRVPNTAIDGFPICITRDKKRELQVTFTDNTHALVVGATRSGKTTGFVLPFLNIMALKKNKPSIVVSDPKGELYRGTGKRFEENGYRVVKLDFQDYTHSECWNPLTKIYRLYQTYLAVDDEVEAVEIDGGYFHKFRGVVYRNEAELQQALNEIKDNLLAEVDNMIVSVAERDCPVLKDNDPYWDDMSAIFEQGFLWAMLEDSRPDSPNPRITEDTYSYDTLLRVFDSFVNDRESGMRDYGYFSSRDPATSKAYQLVYTSIINLSANVTRGCIVSNFMNKMKKFRDTSVRRITCTNTLDFADLDSDQPYAIFVSYKDEDSLHYDTISLFLSDLYTGLIATAREKGGSLSRPFYFLLDEFGNFPRFASFENVISACGSRNIWFMLIVQSYAQLDRVYGKDTSEIILDNLNMHIFFGSCNHETKQAFSNECGSHVIFSPLSAINGTTETIERYEKEIVPLVPVSRLNQLEAGECIVTQMRGDVLWSRLESSYLCPE